ncbi:MAG: hypothetical protein IPJ30_10395 [Acidobacteria bacterium]|nr:hypothetical protein [Acidobacteriota bacterium]
MYQNRHGRFTAVDPLLASGKSANPQTFNRFVYCLNSPLACIDPTGLFGEWYIKTTTEKKEDGGTVTTRTWEEFDSNPGDDWTRVEFGSRDYIRRDNACRR